MVIFITTEANAVHFPPIAACCRHRATVAVYRNVAPARINCRAPEEDAKGLRCRSGSVAVAHGQVVCAAIGRPTGSAAAATHPEAAAIGTDGNGTCQCSRQTDVTGAAAVGISPENCIELSGGRTDGTAGTHNDAAGSLNGQSGIRAGGICNALVRLEGKIGVGVRLRQGGAGGT